MKNLKSEIALSSSQPAQITGNAIIQLFKDNKIKYEVSSKNIIMDWIKKAAFLDYFFFKFVERGSRSGTAFSDVLKCMVLSDDDSPESHSNNLFYKGNAIGYAFKDSNSSGTDYRLGTFLPYESKLYLTSNDSKIRYVFEWPGYAANGNINSIWWLRSESPSTGSVFYPIGQQVTLPSSPAMDTTASDGVYIYEISYDRIRKGLIGSSTFETFIIDNSSGYNYHNNNTIYYKDGFLYSYTHPYRFKFDSSINIVDKELIDSPLETEFAAKYSFKFSMIEDRIILYQIFSSGGMWILEKNTSNQWEIRKYFLYNSIPEFGSAYVSSLVNYYNRCIFARLSSGMTVIFDKDLNVLRVFGNSDNSAYGCFPSGGIFEEFGIGFGRYSSEYNQYVLPANVTAQNLLPETVVKTSDNVMRITYEFDIRV